jgi:hypothetical protein
LLSVALLSLSLTGRLRLRTLNQLATPVFQRCPLGNPGDLVFPYVNAACLRVYLRLVFASMGIKDALFHSLPYTATSWLVMEGLDLCAVGRILATKRRA